MCKNNVFEGLFLRDSCSFSKSDVVNSIRSALDNLREKDSDLLAESSSERSICFRIGHYLQLDYSDFNVDCEYNRYTGEPDGQRVPKTLIYSHLSKSKIHPDDLDSRTVFPDIIVHRRGCDIDNLIVIEVKKSPSSMKHPNSYESDREKLRQFKERFNYRFPISLIIQTGKSFGYRASLLGDNGFEDVIYEY